VNGAKGHSALQMSRDLDCQYKSAYVMCHKIREALGAEANGATVSGEVEVDGAYFGGYVKPANDKLNRRDRRFAVNQNGKRSVVVIMRERGGRTLPFVFKAEAASLPTIARRVAPGSTIFADEATQWDVLHARFLTKRINHSESYSDGEACTNMAESFFFPACVVRKSASTTMWPVRTCRPMRARWLGGKITAGLATVSSI
jgi:hypothetical protein